MKSITLMTLLSIVLIFTAGCVQPELGITQLEDTDGKQTLKSEPKVDLNVHDAEFKKGVSDLKDQLIHRNMKKAKASKQTRDSGILKDSFDKKKIINLKKLGVYDIDKRLNKPLGKYNGYKNTTKKVFVKKIDPEKDRLGGKLVCNKQVLTFRIDRSLFIECMEKHDDVSDFSINKLFRNYNLMNIMQHQINDTPSTCKVKLAVSHNSYNDLTECMIEDKAEGGFFKFRNPNSLSYKFTIIKEN